MMICWTRAFGSVMMFRSAVSDLVDRRFQWPRRHP
ncbi:uncharacterized protein CTRU02_203073 [Colletotrichum truncatum]|uniref:Uncharacterized protein n=1 Tax=Colletotrichum truncatum TaxID=5467 RepID=A0ACC3Z8B6_COLTU|nr:uncharacterized protein CTRU02_08910 [Colletotrichum truncatum]KAF6789118.1 hypothetical protein CTRU02_08910 [Colletotrichum truncatum]